MFIFFNLLRIYRILCCWFIYCSISLDCCSPHLIINFMIPAAKSYTISLSLEMNYNCCRISFGTVRSSKRWILCVAETDWLYAFTTSKSICTPLTLYTHQLCVSWSFKFYKCQTQCRNLANRTTILACCWASLSKYYMSKSILVRLAYNTSKSLTLDRRCRIFWIFTRKKHKL
jgi:hypothetical protein